MILAVNLSIMILLLPRELHVQGHVIGRGRLIPAHHHHYHYHYNHCHHTRGEWSSDARRCASGARQTRCACAPGALRGSQQSRGELWRARWSQASPWQHHHHEHPHHHHYHHHHYHHHYHNLIIIIIIPTWPGQEPASCSSSSTSARSCSASTRRRCWSCENKSSIVMNWKCSHLMLCSILYRNHVSRMMRTPPVDPMISKDAKCSKMFSNTLSGSGMSLMSQQRSMCHWSSWAQLPRGDTDVTPVVVLSSPPGSWLLLLTPHLLSSPGYSPTIRLLHQFIGRICNVDIF